MLLGNNGLINKTIESKESYSKGEIKEKVSLLLNEYTIESTTKNDIDFEKFLRKNLKVCVGKNPDNTYSFLLDKYQITTTKNEIISIDLKDNIKLEIENIKDIREEELYSGFNINLKAEFDGLRTNLMIDITTGDVITYKEVQFEYKTLFDNEIVNIMTYNYETIIAEKFEAIISRNIDNTRMKDYYDLYMFVNLKWNDIDKTILRKAIFNTSEKRETLNYIENADKYIELINEDSKLKSLWKNYQNNYAYAKDISFENTIAAIKVINGVIVPAKV